MYTIRYIVPRFSSLLSRVTHASQIVPHPFSFFADRAGTTTLVH